MRKNFLISKEIGDIAESLEKVSFEAYLVGGCVRDLILGKRPKDWDFTTNATPEQVIALFPHTFYENTYGTVGVVIDSEENDNKLTPRQSASSPRESATTTVVEITPYRLESDYSDGRRPDSVKFGGSLEDDLKRRDFTMNALAYSVSKGQIVDLYNGQKDIEDKIIRTVGEARERFSEDALRILRAVRFLAELDFEISPETEKAILEHGHMLSKISKERIREEFTKLIMSERPMAGLLALKKLNLLRYVVPELEKTVGIEQNKAHAYDVWEHLLRSVQESAKQKWPLEIRLAALFHDISKPESRRWAVGADAGGGKGGQWTFYGHEVVGARTAKKILEDLRYPKKIIDKVVTLVRWHMFFSDTEQISLSAVRRMIANVGKENIWDLMNVRICDRIGTGRPKADPYRLRKYHAMIDEALRDPISVGMLKIDGKKIMEVTESKPGPKIGFILHTLLEEVLEDPFKNTAEYLENKAKNLINLPEDELKKLGEKGKELKEEKDQELIKEIHKKHWVE